MKKTFLLTLISSLSLFTSFAKTMANEMYRNPYNSPYSSGPSYRSGNQDCNDVSHQYGNQLGGPTLRCDDGKHYQCDNYGSCYYAF